MKNKRLAHVICVINIIIFLMINFINKIIKKLKILLLLLLKNIIITIKEKTSFFKKIKKYKNLSRQVKYYCWV